MTTTEPAPQVDEVKASDPVTSNDSVDITARGFSRRSLLVTGALGATGLVVAACGSPEASPAPSSPAPTTAAPSTTSAKPTASPSGTVITKVADVPVGGGQLVKADGTTLLVAQPTAGNVVCHSGICTHEGCPLTQIEGDEGICDCHGSRFNINTGAVIQGPAQQALGASSVKVVGGNVVLA